MVEPEIVSEALKEDVASRSHLSVCPGFEYISTLIYCIFISSDTFLVEEKPVMSLSCSVYEIQTQKILAWITK